MRCIFLLAVLSVSAFAQPELSLTVTPAGVDVVLGGSSGTTVVASIEYTLNGLMPSMAVNEGPDAIAAMKSIECMSPGTSGTSTCVQYSVDQNIMTDGVIAVIPIAFPPGPNPGIYSFSLVNPMAAALDGTSLPITAPTQSVTVVSPCDLSRDGKIDIQDVEGVIGQIFGVAACTTGDLNGDGKCDIVDLQRVVNAAAGGACKVGK